MEIRRGDEILQTNAGTRFIDDVDGLIRQISRRDVAVRQQDRLSQGVVAVMDMVVLFVFGRQAFENLDGFVFGRRLDDDALETAFESGVFFDALLVFVKRRGANALDFAARESGLQNVGGVHGAFGAAGSDDGMQFVQEKDDLLGTAQFVHDGFEPLFKLSAIFRSSHK